MKSLIGKTLKIVTVENVEYFGKVYVIDPIYKTVVLHCNKEATNSIQTVFVLFQAIKSVNIVSDQVDEKYLETGNIQIQSTPIPSEELRLKLKRWLKHMFINVEECGDYLKIDDHLVIVPPYGPDNCICNNTIILERIRNIIELMPPEFH